MPNALIQFRLIVQNAAVRLSLALLIVFAFVASLHAQPPAMQELPPPLPPPSVSTETAPPLNPPVVVETKPAARTKSVRKPSLKAILRTPGDLTLRNASLTSALFTISELWKINLVVGEDVQGKVNGVFKEAPLQEILDSILLSNGYSYRSVGKSLVIMKMADLGQVNPLFESAIVPVHRGDAKDIAEGAKLYSSPKGQLKTIESSRSIFVLDFPDRVQMIRKFIEKVDASSFVQSSVPTKLDAKMECVQFATQYVEPSAAKEAISVVMSKEGKVTIMELDRRIVVYDFPENIAQVRSLLQQIDVPHSSVRIHALIYDISLEDIESLGFNWNHAVKGRLDSAGVPQSVFSLDSITKVPFTAGTPGATMTFGNLSRNFDITAVVRAIQTAKDARLLADPNVVVVDNREAYFESITEIPYQQLTQTTQGGQLGTTAFKQAGIKLRVIPKIAGDGTIVMEIEPEFSRLAGFTPETKQPIIDTRRTTSHVHVANKQTLVISGLRQRNDTGDFSGVPKFKDVRMLGHLFRGRETQVRESELLIFIMPEIITYNDLPKPRQMLAAETTLHRLNQVPTSEGAPTQFCPQESQESPAIQGEEIILPSSSYPTTNVPNTSVTRQQVARLPSITPLNANTVNRTADASSAAKPTTHGPKSRLRIPYDRRYRATGGTDLANQRFEEPAEKAKRLRQEAAKSAEKAKPKKSFWKLNLFKF